MDTSHLPKHAMTPLSSYHVPTVLCFHKLPIVVLLVMGFHMGQNDFRDNLGSYSVTSNYKTELNSKHRNDNAIFQNLSDSSKKPNTA